ncbi:phage tail protein [Helicobacter valdiviensis]|uniref:Phage tail protein n=1 Tax=Helicobacter valdiviensis TaxID=1458358 RepID=A0A2W6MRS1_9HELI|nr:phage tail protein [Helicobacter valdiviensis]PZT47264.1 phage tail protein [Helicobacter valdiviensis]
MIFSLGDFKFSALHADELSISVDYGIGSNERINNHPCLFNAKKESQTLSISGKTIPLKDGNNYLSKLKEMGSSGLSFSLCSANGIYYGKFVIKGLEEKQSVFIEGSGFLEQSFSLNLERDFDE